MGGHLPLSSFYENLGSSYPNTYMFETALVKLLGYGVFWSYTSRQCFRANVLAWILRAECFIIHSTLKPVPRFQGERLVRQHIRILNIPVFSQRRRRPKYRIALLVDEFFGGWDTPIGGYGALARKYICKFIPNEDIEIDLLLDSCDEMRVQKHLVDQTMLYRLPRNVVKRQQWLDKQAYNLFLSIEMTEPSFALIRDYETNTPLLYWIQDPRDLTMYQPRLQTVNLIRDYDWDYIKEVSVWLSTMMQKNRVSFISQGESLSKIAREMYHIPNPMPIEDVPNPVDIECDYRLNSPPKENKVIVLGRLEAQKRVWIACEIAKAMPQHEFYILGATGKGRNEAANAKALEPYRNPDGSSAIKNLHFAGHVDGNVKSNHIKTATLLLNTSIWEGIPVSWLEALSYGTLIVSAFERDNIVGRFGTFVGEVLGDGTDKASIKKFADAITYWMTHETERIAKAQSAIEFVRERHSISAFTTRLRTSILNRI